MKINEVIAFTEIADEKQKKKSWNAIKKEFPVHGEKEVDGVLYKIYIDDKQNIMFVYDEGAQDFVPADQNFIRRALGKNLTARIKKLFNFTKPGAVKAWFDHGDLTQPGAGVAAKAADRPFFQKWLTLFGARLGGLADRKLAAMRSNKQGADAWQQVYGVKAPKPGDQIEFKTSDNRVLKAEFVTFKPDADGDGVPDVAVKGFYNPDSPTTPTSHVIPSKSIVSINGVKLTPQKLSGKERKDLGQIEDPADPRVGTIDTSY